jgi:hypothetical protein
MRRNSGSPAWRRKDMELMSSRITVQLGSMLVVGFGVMIAALKFLLS